MFAGGSARALLRDSIAESVREHRRASAAPWSARESEAAHAQIAACLGMSFWKRRRIAEFLQTPRGVPAFRDSVFAAIRSAGANGGSIAVWASREPAELAAKAQAADIAVVRVEDGFLRSVGLGADFIPGWSIVLDKSGIYYDPSRPSDLENILAETAFTSELRARARRLIDRLVDRGFTKYNLGGPLAEPLSAPGRSIIFVPGQVEDDRSVVLGCPRPMGNLDLLARVRRENSDAYVIYKPHPDVDAGHRKGALKDRDVLRFADRVVRGASSAAIIACAHEIHTLTSLVGFEALIRRRKVVTYGQPFYASWGLTDDCEPLARRQRRLTLEELVAGALILYPVYLDPVSKTRCTVETLVERFDDPVLWRTGILVALRRAQGAFGRRLHLRSNSHQHSERR